MLNWPTELMAASIVLLGLAILVPWKVPRRFRIVSSVVLVAISLVMWNVYEGRLKEIIRPGDPLIRVDLFLIVPLFVIGILNLAFLVSVSAVSNFHGRQ